MISMVGILEGSHLMNIIFVPAESADAWKALLAQPDRQWKKGFSARTLAYCWQEANGFPPEIAAVLGASSTFPGIEPLWPFPSPRLDCPEGQSLADRSMGPGALAKGAHVALCTPRCGQQLSASVI